MHIDSIKQVFGGTVVTREEITSIAAYLTNELKSMMENAVDMVSHEICGMVSDCVEVDKQDISTLMIKPSKELVEWMERETETRIEYSEYRMHGNGVHMFISDIGSSLIDLKPENATARCPVLIWTAKLKKVEVRKHGDDERFYQIYRQSYCPEDWFEHSDTPYVETRYIIMKY